jgi:TrbL/VirB6 plasmid conjugal transfer protein
MKTLMKIATLAIFALLATIAASHAANCTYQTQLALQDSTMKDGAQAVIDLICEIHSSAYASIDSLKKAANEKYAGGYISELINGVIISFASWVAMLFVSYGLIIMAFQVVEVVIRLGIYGAFAPILIYFYIYPNTRPIFDMAVKGFIYAVFKFALLGLFTGAALLMIKICMNSSGISEFSASGVANAIAKTAMAIVACMMIARLMAASSTIAASLSQYMYSNIGIATGGAQSIATSVSTGIGMVAPMVGTLGGAAMGAGGMSAIGLSKAFMRMPNSAKGAVVAAGFAALTGSKYLSGQNPFGSTGADPAAEGQEKSPLPEAQRTLTNQEKISQFNG